MNKKLIAFFVLFNLSSVALADEFDTLATRCAPDVHPDTLRALVKTESSFNPYAIGVVGGSVQQPKSFYEAMTTISELELSGKNYSVGLAQINRSNFKRYSVSPAQLLDACTNLKIASKILSGCFNSALKKDANDVKKNLRNALSCYYSGNFVTGHEHGYVKRVIKNSKPSIPSIAELEGVAPVKPTEIVSSVKPNSNQSQLIF